MYNTMMLMVACILVAAKGLSPDELEQVRQEWLNDEEGGRTPKAVFVVNAVVDHLISQKDCHK